MASRDGGTIKLTDEQQAVVACVKHPVLVLAMVGSGKTLTMAERLRWAIETDTVPANRTLCLTFTNRAAREIRERVESRLGEQARAVFCATFHRFCAEVLRHDGYRLGIPREYTILDDVDGPELLREIAENDLLRHMATTPERAARRCWELLTRVKLLQQTLDEPLEDIVASLPDDHDPSPFEFGGPSEVVKLLRRYDRALSALAAVDFSDLIRYVRHLFLTDDTCRRYWADRFQWIQVDEIQDTHLAEYAVLELLARDHKRLSFFGDIAQTIYEWRGSCPMEVLKRYRKRFQPREFSLSYNFRATRQLIRLAAWLLRRYAQGLPTPQAPKGCPDGEPVVIVNAASAHQQAAFIARDIAQHNLSLSRTVVLTRTRNHAAEVAKELEKHGVPTCLVDRFEFFRRQEVKDAICLLRLLLNPFESWSARRLLPRLRIGVGPRTIKTVVSEGRGCHLRLSDLLMGRTWRDGDPFGALLASWDQGTVVVLDVETTGLDPQTAEVIEFYGAKVAEGRIVDELHLLLWPIEGPLEAQEVHGLTEDILSKRGVPPAEAFKAIREFLAGAHIVGHNVGFDLEVLQNHARRCGIELPDNDWDDTRELARRVLTKVERYDLSTLAATLKLTHQPSHRAADDVHATVELADKLLTVIRSTAEDRRQLLSQVADPVRTTAAAFDQLRSLVAYQPPASLLDHGLQLTGLAAVYGRDTERERNLKELVRYVEQFQGGKDVMPGRSLLQSVLHKCALVRNVELTLLEEGLPVLPVHQVKGMEFDTVYVAGLENGLFPLYSRDRGQQARSWDEEEERIFYVAATRPKRRLVLLGEPNNAFIQAAQSHDPE